MNRFSLGIAVALLSSAWIIAQASVPPAEQNQAGSTQSAQQPDKSKTATSDKSAQAIEGCLTGAANVFVLTDANGKTYELTGDTSGLAANVDHRVRLLGHAGSTGGGALITARGPQGAFGVESVQSISNTCK